MKDEFGKWKVGSLILSAVFLLSACSSGTGIESHEAWVRIALQGENTALYLILHNHTDMDVRLIGISTDVANVVELHSTEVANDMMQMRQVGVVEIAADSEVEFKSGGFHIMLIGLKKDLKVGDEITISFDFENYQDVSIKVPVKESAEEHQSHP